MNQKITNMKAILTILVVCGHFPQILIPNATRFSSILQGTVLFIYTFHMPMYVFISGFLSKNVEKRRKRAFEDLLIPFFVFQIIFASINILCGAGQHAFKNPLHPEFTLWYLLSLFTWRLFLPDLARVRGILPIAVILNVGTAYMTGVTNAFSAQRTFGFLIFFMLGYFADEEWLSKISRVGRIPAAILLLAECGGWIVACRRGMVNFDHWLAVLTHTARYDATIPFQTGIEYAIVLAIAVINSVLFIGLVGSGQNIVLSRIGAATLPVYVSHAALYLATGAMLGAIAPEETRTLVVVLVTVACLIVFSNRKYVEIFDGALDAVRSVVIRTRESA